jgi:hypothetical protein
MASPQPQRRIATVAMASLAALAPAPAAQTAKAEKTPARDPYTRGEAAAMAKARYDSFGPFAFGDRHDTLEVENVLGVEGGIRWVETPHFKIGIALPEYTVRADHKSERAKIRAELEALKERLPRIRPSATVLDPWLRLHLFAQRAEDLFAEFSALLGDVAFAEEPDPSKREVYGEGPYLGQPAKFTVLLVQKTSVLGQYSRTFLERDCAGGVRHNFADIGSLFVGLAVDEAEGEFTTDTALHCDFARQMAATFVDALESYRYDVPVWLTTGIGDWFSRRIEPRFSRLGEEVTYQGDPRRAYEWEPRVRGRVRFDTYPRAEELLSITDAQLAPIEQMMAWSRIDFLMSRRQEMGRFLIAVKGLSPSDAIPSRAAILGRQAEALRESFGFDAEGFDRAWAEYVLATYPKKLGDDDR